MKKNCFLLALALLPASVVAETLTPQQALQRAGESVHVKGLFSTRSSVVPVYTAMTENSAPAVYVFDRPQAGGYVLVGADDVAAPVLGYADSGSFDATAMPPQLEWWLGEYARQIAYASENGGTPAAAGQWIAGDAIEPLINAKWDQRSPYNDECPLQGGARSVTGCVATAMAQVMHYWKYPEKGTGTVTATIGNGNDAKKTEPLDLSTITFDWANMTDTYGTSSTAAQKKAVAQLMKACGYAVDMAYTSVESGAQTVNIPRALVNNFGYNKNLSFRQRQYYSAKEWATMVYEELKAKRPVLYSGSALLTAHQFVCDGYDGKGYFHFNWGWSGMSDGYFLLEALNPTSTGTGGGIGGYNYWQTIIQGVQKETSAGVHSVMGLSSGNVIATAQGMNLTVSVTEGAFLSNIGFEDIKNATTGMIITPADGGADTYISLWSFQDLKAGWGWNSYVDGQSNINLSFTFPGLADGTYEVKLAYRNNGSQQWIPVDVTSGYSSSFKVVKKGNTLVVENSTTKNFSVSGSVAGDIYKGLPVRFKVTVKNDTDTELTRAVCPGLYDVTGNLRFGAEGYVITLAPGEEVTKEWTGSFSLMNGQTDITADTPFTLRFFNPDTWVAYSSSSSVRMLVNKGQLVINTDGISFPGEKWVASIESNDGAGKESGYEVATTKFPVEIKIVNTGEAYFGNQLFAELYYYDRRDVGGGSWVAEYVIPEIPSIAGRKNADTPAASQTIKTEVEFPQIQKGKSYFLAILYQDGNEKKFIQPYQYVFFRLDTSGVGGIEADGAGISMDYNRGASELSVTSGSGVAAVRVMTVAGAVAAMTDGGGRASVSLDLSGLKAGVYIVTATTTEGKIKAFKIVR